MTNLNVNKKLAKKFDKHYENCCLQQVTQRYKLWQVKKEFGNFYQLQTTTSKTYVKNMNAGKWVGHDDEQQQKKIFFVYLQLECLFMHFAKIY